jgi:Cu-processing system permease protein
MLTIASYTLRDVLRSRFSVAYFAFFFSIAWGLLNFEGDGARAVLSLMYATLWVVPLVGIVFGTLYLYNQEDFNLLVLSHPVARSTLYAGLFGGLTLSFGMGFFLGTGLPFLFLGFLDPKSLRLLSILLVLGVFLTAIFIALGMLVAISVQSRTKGLGVSLGAWVFMGILYDGLILWLVHTFGDYPLERPILFLSFLNPLDLGRILLLLQTDLSSLMGYTGALFKWFLGGGLGMALALLSLVLWVLWPFFLGMRLFSRKDL